MDYCSVGANRANEELEQSRKRRLRLVSGYLVLVALRMHRRRSIFGETSTPRSLLVQLVQHPDGKSNF